VKKSLIIGIIGSILVLSGATAFVVIRQQEKAAKLKVRAAVQEKDLWETKALQAKDLLSQKEEELIQARKKNFQQDLAAAQASLKEANEKLGQALREKAALENTGLVYDSRLKNTTQELTKTLQELKKARQTLGNAQGPYESKLAQLEQSLKSKDEQIRKFQAKLGEDNVSGSSAGTQGRDFGDALRKYQAQIEQFEKTVTFLNRSVEEKERLLAQKEAELEKFRKLPLSQRAAFAKSAAGTQEERSQLEKQISSSSARLFDQQEQLEDLKKTIEDLKDALGQREDSLSRKERELRERTLEVQSLRAELDNLSSASSAMSQTAPLLSETQKALEVRVRSLQAEKIVLEEKLEAAQRKSGARAETKDPFADRNFRVLTEALVRKEEQINQMETELASLRKEKRDREGGSGLKERRLAELEILVGALTKQLGEYATLLDRKDAELKSVSSKTNALLQEIEAQKVAFIALQRELAQAKGRQEKTFQTLTQVMSLNSGSDAVFDDARAAGDPYADTAPESMDGGTETKPTSGAEVRKRAEEIRRRVEVLLEGKEK
jgi:chromosome segregation ATPase